MLYSLKKCDRRWKSKSQKHNFKINRLWNNTHSLSPPPLRPWYESTTPPPLKLCHPPIIHNNNTMDTEFLVQIRQSNKCGSERNDEIFNLNLRAGAGPWVSIPCLLQVTGHLYWFHLSKQLTRKKQRTQKWNSTLRKSYRTALAYVHRTQG